MLVVRIGFACLRSVPHDLVLLLVILANQRTAAGGGDHLIAVERQHTVLAERAQHLTFVTTTHTFGSVLNHRNTVLVGNRHDLIDTVRHAVECYRNNSFRVLARLGFAVQDRFLQQLRIHIPCILLRVDEHRHCTQISDRVGTGAERKRLHAHFVPRLNAASNQCQMHRCRSCRQGYHFLVFTYESFQVFLKPVHIRSQRHYPIGIKRLFDVLLLQSRFGHMSQAQIYSLPFHIRKLIFN